jgi:lipoprotein-releasing system ATP-binding protein
MSIEKVSVLFGEREILQDVSLTVPERSIMTITGKSGSGKSTLLGVMSGLLKPQQGRVLFNNEDIFKWFDFKRSRFRNRHIGFVFQFFNLLPDMTAYQNILYPSTLNVFSRDRREEAEYLIEHMGLQTIRNQLPATLSGGELQRVAIARSIINKPDIVLADEPTGNLDDATASGIVDLFFEIKERYGISFVIVTHDRRIVDRADCHYHIEKGQLRPVRLAGHRAADAVPARKPQPAAAKSERRRPRQQRPRKNGRPDGNIS